MKTIKTCKICLSLFINKTSSICLGCLLSDNATANKKIIAIQNTTNTSQKKIKPKKNKLPKIIPERSPKTPQETVSKTHKTHPSNKINTQPEKSSPHTKIDHTPPPKTPRPKKISTEYFLQTPIHKITQKQPAEKILPDLTLLRALPVVRMPKQSISLGEMANSSGTQIEAQKSIETGTAEYTAECSCRGFNQNCFRCDGTGYYQRKILLEAKSQSHPNITRSKTTPKPETTFSSDSRGGFYGIRENGKFSSNPISDNYDE